MKTLLLGVVLAVGIAVPAVIRVQASVQGRAPRVTALAHGVATDTNGVEYQIAIEANSYGVGNARITGSAGDVLSGPVNTVLDFLCPKAIVNVCDDNVTCFEYEDSTYILFDEANQTLSLSLYPDYLVTSPFLVLTMTQGRITARCP